MTDNRKVEVEKGYVPQRPPKPKPVDEGYVPPKPPKAPNPAPKDPKK